MRSSAWTRVLATLAGLVLVLWSAGCGDATSGGGEPRKDVVEDTGSTDGGGDLQVDTTLLEDTTPEEVTPDVPAELPECLNGAARCNGACCASDERCEANACVKACADGRGVCGEICCPNTYECVLDVCAPACATGPRCGVQQDCCAADELCGASGQCELACPTQFFCGPQNECCTTDQICFLDGCTTPGLACINNEECNEGDYCEQTIGKCLSRSALPVCEYIPTSDFNPGVEWSWEGSTVMPAYDMVMAAPIVINMTDDNGDGLIDSRDIPDVLFPTYTAGAYSSDGYVRVLSGDNGAELNTFTSAPVHGSTSLAAGDIDNDGRPEVIAIGTANTLIIFEDDGTVKHQIAGLTATAAQLYGGAAIADLDSNGWPEVVFGLQAFDPVAGVKLWDRTNDSGCNPAANTGYAPYSVLMDMDMDPQGRLEVVTSNCVLDGFGNVLWQGTAPDGFIAVGNLDADPNPEIANVSNGTVSVWEHDLSTMKWSVPIPFGGRGGPPTIANFDDEPGAEIAVAGGGAYLIVKNVIDPNDGGESGVIIWESVTQDLSSQMTGSSVFDFEGDGVAEAVYNDECFLHIYDTRFAGDDPQCLKYLVPSTSHTLFEYPLIVDVDNDGNAEIVAMRNNGGGRAAVCEATWNIPTAPAFKQGKFDTAIGSKNGIQVIGDLNDNWVPTRRVWNEHTYHITNVTEHGTIPQFEEPNRVRFNNFRQNSQGEGLFNAPDLVAAEVTFDVGACPATLTISVTVRNDGALGVGPGLPVSFYLVDATGTQTLLGTSNTTGALLPGSEEVVSFAWSVPINLQGQTFEIVVVVDDDGTGAGTNNECNEANNSSPTGVTIECADIT